MRVELGAGLVHKALQHFRAAGFHLHAKGAAGKALGQGGEVLAARLPHFLSQGLNARQKRAHGLYVGVYFGVQANLGLGLRLCPGLGHGGGHLGGRCIADGLGLHLGALHGLVDYLARKGFRLLLAAADVLDLGGLVPGGAVALAFYLLNGDKARACGVAAHKHASGVARQLARGAGRKLGMRIR